jgi:hypothetical protein
MWTRGALGSEKLSNGNWKFSRNDLVSELSPGGQSILAFPLSFTSAVDCRCDPEHLEGKTNITGPYGSRRCCDGDPPSCVGPVGACLLPSGSGGGGQVGPQGRRLVPSSVGGEMGRRPSGRGPGGSLLARGHQALILTMLLLLSLPLPLSSPVHPERWSAHPVGPRP